MIMRLTRLLLIALGLLLTASMYAQKISVSGTVKDANGVPVVAATVFDKENMSVGTSTDDRGFFRLNLNKKTVITVACMGYVDVNIAVSSDKVLDIVLEEDNMFLDEAVAIGYGSVTKRDLTGSVARANMESIRKSEVVNLADGLGGRIAGLNITTSDGAPGSEASVSIRSGGFSQDASPLFVIDGFPIENFSLNMLDPQSVESIDVLKDASSIAIYGSRGANGVVIINTKQSKSDKVRVSYNGNVSLSLRPRFIEMMSPYEYVKMQLELEALEGNRSYIKDRFLGEADADGNRERNLEWYRNDEGTDWQKAVTRNAVSHNHNISVSGGSRKTRYNALLGYTDQNGLVRNTGMDRFNVKLSLEQELTDFMRFTLMLNHSTATTMSNTAFNQARQFFPTTGFLDPESFIEEMEQLLAEGTITESGIDYGSLITPVQQMENEYDKRVQSMSMVSGKIQFKINKYLTFTPSVSYTANDTQRDQFYNSKTRQGMIFKRYNGAMANVKGINANRNINKVWSILSENILRYNRTFKKDHKFEVLGGFTYQYSEWNPYSFSVSQIPQAFEHMKMDRLDLGTPYGKIASQKSANQLVSFLGRVNYTLKNRYLFTASLRNDGSSKFAKGHQWGLFPSGAFAWRFSEEKFMQKAKRIISDAKFRISCGSVGNNRNVMDYAYVIEFNAGDNMYEYPLDANGNELGYGVVPFFYANKELTWEKTYELNTGFDFSFFRDRLYFSVDGYSRRVTDMLIPKSLPYYMGYMNGANTRVENAGTMTVNGVEVTLNSLNMRKRRFMWSTEFTFSYVDSRINDFVSSANMMSAIYKDFSPQQIWLAEAGASSSQIYGFVFDGLYQIEDFNTDGNGNHILKDGIPTFKTVTGGYRVQPGDPKYKDLNDDGTIDDNDRTILGSPLPKITGGLSNTFTWGQWALNIFFQYNFGNKLINFNKAVYESTGSYSRYTNQYASYADRWTPDNTDTDIPRLLRPSAKGDVSNISYPRLSSRLIEDGSFVRLKNVSLSYSIPSKVLRKAKMEGVTFNLSAQNLLLFTKYTGQDPETNSYFGAGDSANTKGLGYATITNSSPYTSLSAGLDKAMYPKAITVTFGVNITF